LAPCSRYYRLMLRLHDAAWREPPLYISCLRVLQGYTCVLDFSVLQLETKHAESLSIYRSTQVHGQESRARPPFPYRPRASSDRPRVTDGVSKAARRTAVQPRGKNRCASVLDGRSRSALRLRLG